MIRHITTPSVAVWRKLATSAGAVLLVLAVASAQHALAVPLGGGPSRITDPERVRRLSQAFRGTSRPTVPQERSRPTVPQENRVALTLIRNGTNRTVYFEVIDPQHRQLGWRKAALDPGKAWLAVQYLSPQDQANNVRIDVPVRFTQRQKGTWSHGDHPWRNYEPTKYLVPRVVPARGLMTSRIINNRREEAVDYSKLREEHVHHYVFVDIVGDADIWAEVNYDRSQLRPYENVELTALDNARRQRARLEKLRKVYEYQRRQQAEQRRRGY